MVLRMRIFKREKIRSIPIIGVRNAGKTYFIVSLGHLISKEGWGEVLTYDYFHQLEPYVLAQQPIPPTVGYHPVRVRVDYVEYQNKRFNARIVLSTGDISGIEFEQAMQEVKTFKFSKKSDLKNAPPTLGKLYRLLLNSDGLIVLIDITKYLSEVTHIADAVFRAFSYQIEPISTALEMVINFGEFSLKPLFFVFSKQDIHKLTVNNIRRYFQNAWAILLRRLERRLVNIKLYTVSAVGWSDNPEERLKARGFDKLLFDLVRSFQD